MMTNKEKNEVILNLHNEGKDPREISTTLRDEHELGINADAVGKRLRRMGVQPQPIPRETGGHLPDNINSGGTVEVDKSEEEVHKPQKPKTGIETRNDGRVVINWTTRTIITDLGDYGTYVCSFARHQLIQRAYSNDYNAGSPDNQSDIAMRFDFQNANAVAKYMKLHGIRHSSLGQTDLEFEEGLTVEDAVDENMQARRRAAHKKTQQRLWRETQKDADAYRNLDESFLTPLREDIKANLPKFKPQKLRLPKPTGTPFLVLDGLTDWHFLKSAFGPDGRPTYGIEIASESLKATTADLIEKSLRFGTPEKYVLVIGSDNFHIDNPNKTTTRGTPQDVEGEYETGIKQYIDMMIWNVEAHRQVAPVQLVVAPGNHDYITSLWLGHLLQYRYEDADDVEVVLRNHPRTYIQFGNYCLGFTHGEEFASNAKMERNIHKVFLAEARDQGVKIGEIEHFYMFAGHLHHEFSKDFGIVTFNIMPSLCGDDRWHKKQGFIGSRQQTKGYLIDAVDGLVGNTYSVYDTTNIR